MNVELADGDHRLVLTPERGGAVARFDWRGEAIFRPACGPGPFDTACFALVPFSNRIAEGAFEAGGRQVRLAPNFPGQPDNPHPLHGIGWLRPWRVVASTAGTATLEHEHSGGDWPWPYRARQTFALAEDGLHWTLSLTNLGEDAMPAGLGIHPYFPRNDLTIYRGRHCGEWRNTEDGIPIAADLRAGAIDWWDEAPVGTRNVDTLYCDREGELEIDWPDRGLTLMIRPSAELAHTIVFSPAGQDFFCVEPVSHVTNAVNQRDPSRAMAMLEAGGTLSASVLFTVEGP